MSDSSQAIVAEYAYDAYGNTLRASGAMAAVNTYRYSTKELHGASGLYDYGFRFYSPGLGRWINRDPIEEAGGINVYGFVGNNPVNNWDEYGEYIETALDVAGAAYDVNEFRICPSFWGGVSAIASIAAIAAPVPGPGAAKLAYKTLQIAKKAQKAARARRSAKAAEKTAAAIAKKKAEGAARRATGEALQNIGKRAVFGSRKAAEDAARAATGGRKPFHHPAKNGQPAHFHPRVPKGHPQQHDHYYY